MYAVAAATHSYDLQDRPAYHAGNIEEFLAYMSENGLEFGPALREADRNAYHQAFDMMVRYYLDMKYVANLQRDLEIEIEVEQDTRREAIDVALGKVMSAHDYAIMFASEMKFLAAAERLGVPIADSVVVGDSVWDLLAARRARALGVGLLSGGYGKEELERAGAYRVYQDPADLLAHLDEVGIRAAV